VGVRPGGTTVSRKPDGKRLFSKRPSSSGSGPNGFLFPGEQQVRDVHSFRLVGPRRAARRTAGAGPRDVRSGSSRKPRPGAPGQGVRGVHPPRPQPCRRDCGVAGQAPGEDHGVGTRPGRRGWIAPSRAGRTRHGALVGADEEAGGRSARNRASASLQVRRESPRPGIDGGLSTPDSVRSSAGQSNAEPAVAWPGALARGPGNEIARCRGAPNWAGPVKSRFCRSTSGHPTLLVLD